MAVMPMRRIGMFGGAFDPPHLAHRALAQAAVTQLELDQLLVFPTGHAWHKARDLTPGAQRLDMARIAFAGLPHVQVDGRELLRSGPTYTVDTLRELQAQYPGAALFLLLGTDQATALHTWHACSSILQSATICIAARTQNESATAMADIQKAHPQGHFVHLRMPAMDISATHIRSQIATRQDINHLVPDGIARYIEQHHLYLAAR